MRNKTYLRRLIYVLGILFSTLPPLIATLTYFPLWELRGPAYVFSGVALFMLILSFVPLIRLFRDKFTSPAAYIVWFIVFVFFYILSKIADEVTVIAFFGFVGNFLGALCFKAAGYDKNEGEVSYEKDL